jgi:hypothetical protein
MITGEETRLVVAQLQYAKSEILFKELVYQAPEIKRILAKLYRQHGRTKAGRTALVDELKGLLTEDKS